jgi:hypothetical protein
MPEIQLHSESRAADLGLAALADLSQASVGTNYRVIGGHMVQILRHVYPVPGATIRATTDADVGIDTAAAVGLHLHDKLLTLGYEAQSGNHYERASGDQPLKIDLLIPDGNPGKPTLAGGRGFDAAPGLRLALSSEPLWVDVKTVFYAGASSRFTVLVPTLESAVILKTLVRTVRLVDKDVTDLNALLESAFAHRNELSPWKLSQPSHVKSGGRGDAAKLLHDLVNQIDRGQFHPGATGVNPTRLAALIRQLIARP